MADGSIRDGGAAVAAAAPSHTYRVATIDLGTVSSRLLLAQVTDGVIVDSTKRTVITNLGEGVDATGMLSDAAVDRVLAACEGFLREIAAFRPDRVCTTLTSAARDATNGGRLLAELEALGLAPQVIPGEVEAELTFYGVAHDFPGRRIVVADSGGGSTELAAGEYGVDGSLSTDHVVSVNIGCRRVTDRFLAGDPPSAGEMEAAASWIRPQFETWWGALGQRPDTLVAVGGTVTSLCAMVQELPVYDSSLVHLHELTLAEVEACVARMAALPANEIAQLPCVQADRAPVLLGGALVIRELMAAGGYDRLTVSENSLMAGLAATIFEELEGGSTAIGWEPVLSF